MKIFNEFYARCTRMLRIILKTLFLRHFVTLSTYCMFYKRSTNKYLWYIIIRTVTELVWACYKASPEPNNRAYCLIIITIITITITNRWLPTMELALVPDGHRTITTISHTKVTFFTCHQSNYAIRRAFENIKLYCYEKNERFQCNYWC